MYNNLKLRKQIFLFCFTLLFLCCFSIFLIYSEAEKYWSSHTSFESLCFQISSDYHSEEISCYFDTEADMYYLFLPSFMQSETSRLSLNFYGINRLLSIDGNPYRNGSIWKEYALSTPYIFSFYDWHGNLLEEKSITLVLSPHLPSLFIQTASGNMNTIHEDKENKEAGTLTLLSETGALLNYDSLNYIKGRGNTTWSCSKKPYNISLAHEASLLDMDSGKKWVLLANACDGSYLRNKIAYDTALAMNLPFSPKSEFVDLYLNGEYAGLYQLCENVDVAAGRVAIRNLEAYTRAANERPLEEYEIYDTDTSRSFLIPNNPSDISGGYLLEFAPIKRENIAGFVTDAGQEVVIKSPANASVEQTAYIFNLIQNMETVLSQNDNSITEIIDVNSWVDCYLIAEIFQNVDAYSKSQYFYKPADTESRLIFSGPVWDFDRCIGNHTFGSFVRPGTLYISQPGRCEWIDTCTSQDWFQRSVSEHYAKKLLPYLQDLLENQIDEYALLIEQSAGLDRLRWKGHYNYLIDEEDWHTQVDYLKYYLKEQTAFLTNYWLGDADFCTIHNGNKITERFLLRSVILLFYLL